MITKARVDELLTYDPETGWFSWNVSRGRSCAGDVAGTYQESGYLTIGIDGRVYRAHRLAFLVMTGSMPVEVDHENEIKTDNRWVNLRAATRSQNALNISHTTAASGIKGVVRRARSKHYHAALTINGKYTEVGKYQTREEAALAVKLAREQYHGEFAKH